MVPEMEPLGASVLESQDCKTPDSLSDWSIFSLRLLCYQRQSVMTGESKTSKTKTYRCWFSCFKRCIKVVSLWQKEKVYDHHLACLTEQLRFSGGLQSPPRGVWYGLEGVWRDHYTVNYVELTYTHEDICWYRPGSQSSEIASVSLHRNTLSPAPRASEHTRLHLLLAIAFTLWVKFVFWQGWFEKRKKASVMDGKTFNNKSNWTELNVSVAINSLWYGIKTGI